MLKMCFVVVCVSEPRGRRLHQIEKFGASGFGESRVISYSFSDGASFYSYLLVGFTFPLSSTSRELSHRQRPPNPSYCHPHTARQLNVRCSGVSFSRIGLNVERKLVKGMQEQKKTPHIKIALLSPAALLMYDNKVNPVLLHRTTALLLWRGDMESGRTVHPQKKILSLI